MTTSLVTNFRYICAIRYACQNTTRRWLTEKNDLTMCLPTWSFSDLEILSPLPPPPSSPVFLMLFFPVFDWVKDREEKTSGNLSAHSPVSQLLVIAGLNRPEFRVLAFPRVPQHSQEIKFTHSRQVRVWFLQEANSLQMPSSKLKGGASPN